jgi:hypothetical protein
MQRNQLEIVAAPENLLANAQVFLARSSEDFQEDCHLAGT